MASPVDATSPEFLLSCLRSALGSVDTQVAEDIVAVCEGDNINSCLLASGLLSVEEAAERLFLTAQEASVVLAVCKREVDKHAACAAGCEAGVKVRLSTGAGDSVQLSIRPTGVAEQFMQPLVAGPVAASSPAPLQPASVASLLPVEEDEEDMLPPPRSLPAPATVLPAPAAVLPAAAPAASSAPAKAFVDESRNSPKVFVASYLRPTTSSQRQTKAERLAADAREVKPKAAKPSKGAGVFARLGHTLVAPTAAFLARMTGSKKVSERGSERALSKSVGSRMLERVLDSPQGQRVTRPEAFHLTADARPKALLVSSDDLALAKAQEQAFKPNTVPRHVYESRHLEFRAASSPKRPQDVFVPFELASLERHAQRQREISQEAEAKQSADAEARQFHAMKWSKDMVGVESVAAPPKPQPQAATVAAAFTFQSQARAVHYAAVIEPVKKAKEVAKEAEEHPERVEEARKEQVLADLSVSDFRKTLDFKAITLPDFSAPFSPDKALSASPTTPQAFALRTTARLGEARPASARQDMQGHRLPFGAGAFAQSLRGSTGGTMMNTSALQRSAATVSLTRSTASPLGSPSPLPTRGARQLSASPASTTTSPSQRHSLSLALRANLKASLAQGLAEARMTAAAASQGAGAACVAQEGPGGSGRTTRQSSVSSPRGLVV